MKIRLNLVLMMVGALLMLGALASAQDTANANPAAPPAADGTNPPANASANPANHPQFHDRYPRYHIEAGDQFDVAFDLSPEFNQTVTVQPDGYVTMRGVGDLHVQGETVPELTDTLRKAYGKILNEPIISVVLKDFEKPYFIADGQVGKPGKYDLRGNVTLTQAVAIAGGFQDSAKHSQVVLFRRVDDQWTEAKVFNLKDMEKRADLREDPFLHPGDMVFVPKNAFSKYRFLIPTANMGTYVSPLH